MRGKTNSVTTSGGGTSENTLKKLLDATKSTRYLFYKYTGSAIDDLISYNDTENVTNMDDMFESCSVLTTISLLNTGKATSMNNMFRDSQNLLSIPLLDTSNVTSMRYMFSSCSNLKSIPALDVSKVTNMSSMFSDCYSLESIHMTGMKVSFSISSSTKFTTEALHEIIGNLATVTSSKTLTMGSTNLAKVSEEYKTIATNKGWTLA